MALQYKIDIIKALKEKGISTYIMRKEKILSESTIQKLREGKGIAWENIDALCRLLECQPGDLFEYVSDDTGDAQQLFALPELKTCREAIIFFADSLCACRVHALIKEAGGRSYGHFYCFGPILFLRDFQQIQEHEEFEKRRLR